MTSHSFQNNRHYLVSKQELSQLLCAFAIAILAFNFLLYAFFKVGINKNILRFSAAILLFFSIALGKKRSVIEIILVFFALYMMLVNGNLSQNLAFILLIVIALPSNAEKTWKNLSYIHLLLAGLVVICIVLGIVPNMITNYGGRIRRTLGFTNTNAAAIFFYSCVVTWLAQKSRIRWFDVVVPIAIIALVYRMTDSRTVIVCALLLYFTLFIISKWHNKIAAFSLCLIELALFVLPLFSGLLFKLFPQLDIVLSYRLRLYSNYINAHSFLSLLLGGSNVKETDNFFLCLLFNGGLPFYLFVIGLCLFTTWTNVLKENSKETAIILSTLAFGMMESGVIRCEILCMVLFWYLITRCIKKDQQDEPAVAEQIL